MQHKKYIAKKNIGVLLNNIKNKNQHNSKHVNQNEQQNTPKERTIDKMSTVEDLEKIVEKLLPVKS